MPLRIHCAYVLTYICMQIMYVYISFSFLLFYFTVVMSTIRNHSFELGGKLLTSPCDQDEVSLLQ